MNKTLNSRIALYGFYIVSIINLVNQVVGIEWIDLTTKPLLMVTLLFYYLASRQGKATKLSNLIVGALVFSWFGDVLLMLQGRADGLFIYGLASFLIAHALYIFAYQTAKYETRKTDYTSFIRVRIFFLVFVGGALIYMLFPVLEELLVPVIIYTIVIIGMGIIALMRRGWTTEKSFMMVYSGALFFIMSDSMIGINKFLSPIGQADLLIMSTYIVAQFLIVKGILRHENDPAEENTLTES